MNTQTSRYRWVIFASVLFTYLIMACQRTAPGLITDQLMRDFGVTASTIGLVASMQFFVYTGLQIPMGLLIDRYGPRLFLVAGATLMGVGTVLYSVGVHEWMLFVSRILAGIGDATIWVGLVIILSQWFPPREFSKLIGAASMTGILGFLLATVPFAVWIDWLGWRAAFFSSGMLLVFCGALLVAVLPRERNSHAAADSPALATKSSARSWEIGAWMRRLWMNRQAWALFCCHFGIVGGYIGFIGSWAVPYGMELYGMTRAGASQLIMVSLLGALTGAPLIGWVSGRLESWKRPYLLFQSAMCLCWFACFVFQDRLPYAALLLLFWMMGGAFGANSLTFTLVRHTFPVTEAGLVTGFANTGGFLSAVLLPGLYGYMLDAVQGATGSIRDGFAFGFLVPVVFSVVGIIGVLVVREKSRHSLAR